MQQINISVAHDFSMVNFERFFFFFFFNGWVHEYSRLISFLKVENQALGG